MTSTKSLKINLSYVWIAFLILFSIIPYKIHFLKDIPLYRILYILTFIFILISKKHKNENNCLNNSLKATIFFWILLAIWGVISFVWITKTGHELNYISYDLIWAIVSLCISKYMKIETKKNKILFYYCIIALILALMGLYTGITGHYFNDTHVSYHYNLNSFGLYKPNTIFYNINDNAVFMFSSIIVLFLYTEKKKNHLFKFIGIILFTSNIILVDSRGIELALIIFWTIYFISMRSISFNKKMKIFVFAFILILMFGNKIMDLGIFKSGVSDNARISIINMSLKSLKKSNYLGVGPGNISTVNSMFNNAETYDTHNFFLEIFCDYGIIGAISITAWYVILLKTAYIYRKSEKDAAIIFALLISMLCAFIVSSSVIGKSWIVCFFGIIVSILNNIEEKYKKMKGQK